MRVALKGAKPETAPASGTGLEPVRRSPPDRASDEPDPAALITKGYEYETGRYVTLKAKNPAHRPADLP